MATEKQLIDANAMKHRLEAHIATAIYKGINNIPTSYESCNPTEYLKGYERGAIETANLALGHPLVDAVEVVRCKDCKWRFECEAPTYVICKKTNTFMSADDFCSYGERRNDG